MKQRKEYKKSTKIKICPECGQVCDARGLHVHMAVAHSIKATNIPTKYRDGGEVPNNKLNEQVEDLTKKVTYLTRTLNQAVNVISTNLLNKTLTRPDKDVE